MAILQKQLVEIKKQDTQNAPSMAMNTPPPGYGQRNSSSAPPHSKNESHFRFEPSQGPYNGRGYGGGYGGYGGGYGGYNYKN